MSGGAKTTSKAAGLNELAKIDWKKLPCPIEELRLDITLKCGQSFRWKSLDNKDDGPGKDVDSNNVFIGVVRKRLWLLSQTADSILYHCVNEPDGEDLEADLTDYLQLEVCLKKLYQAWASLDPVFENLSHDFPGVRILRQDPIENLFSFICSANNNVKRISGMVEKLCSHYGEVVVEDYRGERYHSFPAPQALSNPAVEAKLRELGFGYRAKYIQQTAKFLAEGGGEDWLLECRKLDYKEAKERLRQLPGVGPKVADCILLMSLDHPESVPVDTHMLQIAAKQYLPHLKSQKTVTDKVYAEVADHFRKLYGHYAGWAHSVLFSADLRHLQQLKSPEKRKSSGSSPGENGCSSKLKKK